MSKFLTYDAVVIGGGFFGCTIALYLKNYLKRILILEKEAELLQRASYVNQARVHNGYHYPRSILTALRSKINFPQFVSDYRECIISDFNNYYAISNSSKVNTSQFKTFCERIGISINIAPPSIKKLFDSNLINEVFCVEEYVFNAIKLKERMYNDLEKAKIEVKLNTEVIQLKNSTDPQEINITVNSKSCDFVTAKYIFNCTYSSLNTILSASNLPTIPLKHELAEMALVTVPEPIKHLGITVMCGPFFSLMPFPPRHLHTLSHVRYTPHCYWQDTENFASATNKIYHQAARKTNYPYMIRDAGRYMPILKDCCYIDSIWEIKTILPQSEVDDSRPILFKRNQGLPNLTCVLGGKIDNVYDIPNELQFLEHKGFRSQSEGSPEQVRI